MNKLNVLVEKVKSDWSVARRAVHFGQECPFLLRSGFADGVVSGATVEGIPDSACELTQFWEISERADLFKDDEYGQWGVEVLSPQEAIEETARQRGVRSREFRDDDVVFARFYGDSDLLLMDSVGSVYVALPLDNRCDWPRVADSFEDFLEKLTNSQGAKYWEPPKESR
nr:SMI1/KNR4 family protein [Burkholderia ambifaria]